MVEGLNETIDNLTVELESHVWEISPAMAQAKIDELTATSAKQAEEIGRLRTALEKIVEKMSVEPIHPLMISIRDIAQAALKGEKEDG